jgi:hypothetical protein
LKTSSPPSGNSTSQDGFGRTDALARIGNYVFGTELDNDANLRVAKDAP